ncbi:DUF4230 domain-containing protein [Parasphingorhabdus cellanae]|uniref:DUF4230 domain-containing protein n=1 Tax=Parasphingorhabdus cellanae TaxID=2806553 RepID=A0ABX7T693_9SPHN|nr:DUF4230 domain-containing protein [Parasphingorhabdus cellanae]QTD57124.1 DUF4230 domain-containing protein [Parasphingorhabdus cellanae]
MENVFVNRRVAIPLAIMAGVLVILGALSWLLLSKFESNFTPDPVSIASASLDGLREQNRLTVFTASYNATVTTTVSRMGLSARKTLIMPGSVRYEVDLAKLDAENVRWDETTRTLSVEMPPIEIARPEVQIDRIQSYDDGGILMALTDAEKTLDQANRKKGVAELAKQAKNPLQMRLARDAARRAVESSFVLPLRAAGLDAKVDAFFAFERGAANTDRWDVSRSIKDVLADKEKQGAE